MTAVVHSPGSQAIQAGAQFSEEHLGGVVITVGSVTMMLSKDARTRLFEFLLPEGEGEFQTPGPGKGGQ